jgi:hypothetical protein
VALVEEGRAQQLRQIASAPTSDRSERSRGSLRRPYSMSSKPPLDVVTLNVPDIEITLSPILPIACFEKVTEDGVAPEPFVNVATGCGSEHVR